MKVKLSNVRLAFPQLWEAKAVNGEGKPAFSATFILEPGHPAIAEIKKAMQQVAVEKWADKAGEIAKQLQAADKIALHNGDAKSQYQGFAGNLYVSARNVEKPLVIDANKSPLSAADGRPYAGCYVNAVVDIWAQSNQFGKRINASLSGVQFYADGDRFSGAGVADVDDFEPVAGAASAEAGSPAASVFD
jgi:hypothetical protein